MNPIGLESIGWKYYIVYVVILAVESFIAYGWFIETKGKALEEIAVLFDKDQAEPIRYANKQDDETIEETLEDVNVERKV